jgi:hypothetical protein
MQSLKSYLLLAFGGALGGATAASILAPRLIAWYVTPGVPGTQTNVNMGEVAHYIIGRFVEAQVAGAVIGAALLLTLGFVFRGGKKKAPVATEAKAKAGPTTPA